MLNAQMAQAYLRSYVDDIARQIPLLDARRAGAELYGAPRLSLYDLLQPGENALSRLIADFLDPRGTHGQGHLFLNVLLRRLELPEVPFNDVIKVRREVSTPTKRRIDIVVDTKHFILGIENKPWAGQQPNQLADYLDELQRRSSGRPCRLIFLSDQVEKTAKGQIVRMTYQDNGPALSLSSILASTLPAVKADVTRAHVEQFIRYINLQFGDGSVSDDSDIPYIEAVETEFRRGEGQRKAIPTTLLARQKIHAAVIDQIGNFIIGQLHEKVAPDFAAKSEYSLFELLGDKYWPWPVRRTHWPENCFVTLESQKGSFRDVSFGIKAPDPTKGLDEACPDRPKLDGLSKAISGGGKTQHWPWHQTCIRRDWDMTAIARLIIEAPAGKVEDHPEIQELARQFVELAQAVDQALES